MISEEKDMNKLKLKSLRNALAIPLTDGQKPVPLGVLQVYNYDSTLLNEEQLQNMSDMVSGVLLSVESLQDHFVNTDIVESHFNLIQDAVIILSLAQTV
jgi:hypothetical protein